MKNGITWGALLIAGLSLALSLTFFSKGDGQKVQQNDPAYARIMRTRTLRCAYETWPPFFVKDPVNGGFSGVYYDLLEKMGQDWGIKIEWVEETGIADAFEGLRAGRVDAFCAAITPSAQRAMIVDFTRTIGYVPYYLYVRAKDDRFDKDITRANSPAIKLMSLDGYIGEAITREEFPLANLKTLPNLSTDIDVLMNLATGKADGALCDSNLARAFIKNNPGKVRRVPSLPIRSPALSLALPIGEERLKAMMNTSLTDYLETGVIDRLLSRYGLNSENILRPAAPFQTASSKPCCF